MTKGFINATSLALLRRFACLELTDHVAGFSGVPDDAQQTQDRGEFLPSRSQGRSPALRGVTEDFMMLSDLYTGVVPAGKSLRRKNVAYLVAY